MMRTWRIYEHPATIKREVVKIGWSWPGFFFTGIWLLYKRMWGYGIGLFVLFFVLGFIKGTFKVNGDISMYNTMELLISIASILIGIAVGVYGNRIYEDNLTSRGYRHLSTVTAPNKEAALAIYVQEKKDKASSDTSNLYVEELRQ